MLNTHETRRVGDATRLGKFLSWLNDTRVSSQKPSQIQAAYDGRTLLDSISATPDGWLAFSVTGRKQLACASQVAATAQLAIAYPKIGGRHDTIFVLGVSTQFLDIGRIKSHNYGPEFFYFGNQVGYRRDRFSRGSKRPPKFTKRATRPARKKRSSNWSMGDVP